MTGTLSRRGLDTSEPNSAGDGAEPRDRTLYLLRGERGPGVGARRCDFRQYRHVSRPWSPFRGLRSLTT